MSVRGPAAREIEGNRVLVAPLRKQCPEISDFCLRTTLGRQLSKPSSHTLTMRSSSQLPLPRCPRHARLSANGCAPCTSTIL